MRRPYVEATGQAQADHNPPRAPTAVIAGAVVVALAGVVAVSSQGQPVWTSLREGQANRSEILAGLAMLWVVGILVVSAVTLVIHRTVIAKAAGAPPLRVTLLRAVPITMVALAALSLLAIARTDLEGGAGSRDGLARLVDLMGRSGDVWGINDRRNSPVRAGDGDADSDEQGTIRPDRSALIALRALTIAIVAAFIACVAVWFWRRRRSAGVRADDGSADRQLVAAREAVVSTIDVMLADPDPKTAIIGAYARLLEGLAACNIGRRDHEAPMEHLHRVLTRLHVRPEPLRRLIGLFEVARFSTHPLTLSHRDEALEALRSVAADLATSESSLDTGAWRPAGAP